MLRLRDGATKELIPCLRFYTNTRGERCIELDQAKLDEVRRPSWLELELRYESSNDIIDLALLNDALSRIGRYVRLLMPYFPYGDIPMTNRNPALSIKVVAELIRDLNVSSKIEIWDPTNPAVLAIFPPEAITVVELVDLASPFFIGIPKEDIVLICLEGSAVEKALKLSERLGCNCIRALPTEFLRIFEGHEPGILDELKRIKNCVVVTDVYGEETVQLYTTMAKCLKEINKDLTLHFYATHGFFAMNMDSMLNWHYDRICCPNPMGVNVFNYFTDGVYEHRKIQD